jgi:hypothetical protein
MAAPRRAASSLLTNTVNGSSRWARAPTSAYPRRLVPRRRERVNYDNCAAMALHSHLRMAASQPQLRPTSGLHVAFRRGRRHTTEEDVGAHLEILVHEYSRGGVAICRNWSDCEAGHVLAELGDEKRWIHWVCTRS